MTLPYGLPAVAGEMEEETAVAEDLELLADFVAYVTVAGMQGFQLAFKGVDVFVRKLQSSWFFLASGARPEGPSRPEPPYHVEHVQGPAAFGDGEFGEGFDFAEAVADFADGGNDLVTDDADAGVNGNSVEVEVDDYAISGAWLFSSNSLYNAI
jgi:hypothetical protein